MNIALCCAEQHISPLAHFRESQHLTAEALGASAGLPPEELCAIERWERPLSVAEARSLASMLSVPYYVLHTTKSFGIAANSRHTRTSATVRFLTVCAILFILIYASPRYATIGSSPIVFMVVIFAFSILFCLYFLEWSRKKTVQEMRDEDAFEIFWKVRAGRNPPPFVLYLRPFSVTGKMRRRQGLLLNHFAPDVEEQIADTCEGKALLLALGLPGEAMGGGRLLSTEDVWKSDIDSLAASCVLIVMLPSDRPGTMWEFKRIIDQNYLHKTLFLMPRFTQKSEWNKTRETWKASYEMDLPAWGRRGVFDWVEPPELFQLKPLSYVAERSQN
ncbi:hypothetical protein [Rhizobium leguminosarum]|uniref:hypothetical protein n=1 Tax=Rhizobium leguminosarum TaxID=384 RepID=UPI001C984F01|nr:hypothetical protein [Rhizobium leguminosarum]MBY5351295.1 hypothetical protein [Rhizobium leguminosarum]